MDLITYALCHKTSSSPTPIDPSTDDGIAAQKIINLNPTFSQPVLGETNLSLVDVQDVYNIDFQFTLSQEEIDELEALDNAQMFPCLRLNDFILELVSAFNFPPDSKTPYILFSATRINPADFTPIVTYLALNMSDFTGIFVNKTMENDSEELATKEYVDNIVGNIGVSALPSVAAADVGKDLTVNTSGEWVAGKTASWTVTVSAGFAAQSTTVEVNGTSYTKCSDKALTAEQLEGAVFSMQGSDLPISSDMLIDMSSMDDVTGTMIDLTSAGYGPIVFSCTEAGNVVSEPGFYLASDMISYASVVTISYTESLTAQTRAIGIGDMEMEDGVTDLPTGVVWLQYES